ncbi:MAG: NAD-dependent epimerase/dehydratase family protein [Terriglobales bacterium]
MPHSFADFYRGKRVLVTGHTGFEGGWTSAWLKLMGAQVCGYGLPPATRPNFFDATILDRGMTSVFGDVRDRNSLASTFTEIQPEIVIHCAARTSAASCLQEPVDVFSINVMGTVNILEEARLTHSVRAIVLMNTDCSELDMRSGRESEEGGSNQLLSASVASAELARSAFNEGFFQKTGTSVATARTAHAIGGGDWRQGRFVPDLVRAIMSAQSIPTNQQKTGELRIWHVLEAVRGCLLLAKNLFERGQKAARVWDFAPSGECISASEFSEKFAALWNATETGQITSPRLSASISNSEKTEAEPGWSQLLSTDQALAWTVEWYRGFCSDPVSTLKTTHEQIEKYMLLAT